MLDKFVVGYKPVRFWAGLFVAFLQGYKLHNMNISDINGSYRYSAILYKVAIPKRMV